MEGSLLKILKLADTLNEKQSKVYAQIRYTADDRKELEISIRSKEDFSYVEKCIIQLVNNPLIKWDNIIQLFESYIRGCSNE